MENFEVEVLKYPDAEDWMLCKKCTLVTVGKDSNKEPTMEWKRKLIGAQHSPIRTLNFCFRLKNIPSWVATHLVRHVHATPFVKTQRNDRQDSFDRNLAPQGAPVDMCWYMNVEELITIAHKRLCTQASPETREVVKEICRKAIETNPELDGFLVPLCQYRGGLCTEFNPCGLNKKFQKEFQTKEENN